MRRISIPFCLLMVFMATSAYATSPAPAFVPLQGYLTDAEGKPLEGETHIHLKLYDSDTGGVPIFEESQVVMLDEGYFTVYLGMVEELSLDSFRDSENMYLGFAVNHDPEMAPRLVIGTTPYAAFAKYTDDAKMLDGKPSSDFRLAEDPIEWTDLDNVPEGVQDGDADTLGELRCAYGQVIKWVAGDAWTCYDDDVLSPAEVEAHVNDLGYTKSSDLAPVAFSGSFTDLADAPAELLDGDDDSLGGLSCVSGQTAAFNGGSWVCANRAKDTLATLFCADGQTTKWDASTGTWICGTDLDTTLAETDLLAYLEANEYAQMTELAMIAVTGYFDHLQNVPAGLADGDDDTLGRLSCAAGQVPKWGGAGWLCAFDQDTGGDITKVTAGTGLDGGGETGSVALNVDTEYVQIRVSGTCPTGESIREIDSNGEVICEKDSLDNMLCSAGSVPKRTGTTWSCGDDADTLGVLNCASGQVPKRSGTAWVCAEDNSSVGTLTCSTEESITTGSTAQIACPAGTTVTGGGGDCVADKIITSSPNGNGWKIHCETSQANIKVWAVCCQLQ
jgi:hypothetical protein